MNTRNEQPFFARFLEGQEFLKVKTGIKAGPTAVTMKYPSDTDEPTSGGGNPGGGTPPTPDPSGG
jgi:hypothetical protein